MSQTTTRLSAAERKDSILDAALIEFADRGFEGTSTEDIARRAGISQPYLFRLFGTKKELYIASVSRCYRDTLELFQRAAEGLRGEEALQAIGDGLHGAAGNRPRLAPRPDAGLRGLARTPTSAASSARASATSSPTSAASPGPTGPSVWQFFATGMLLNVLASMQVTDNPEPWMSELLAGCGKESD